MKNFILTLIFVISIIGLKAQNHKYISAEVERVLNIPVFIYSYPDSSFDEVGTVDAWGSALLTGMGETVSVRTKIEELVNTAKRRMKKGKIERFDALIVNPDDYSALLIKFEGEKSLSANVNRVFNVPVFMYSYPDTDYDEVGTVSPLVLDNSLSVIVNSVVRRAKKKYKKGKVPKFDAIIISPDDASGILIRFK